MYCNLFDSHIHSDNSFDGYHSVIYLCEHAIRKGLLGIAVTDHCDVDRDGRLHYAQRLRQSCFEICKARAAFGQGFIISAGVEIASPDDNPEFAGKILRQHDYDFVVGSVHTAGEWGDPSRCDFSRTDPYPVLDAYFDKMERLLQWGRFDALGHLDYPLRYICRDGRWDVTLERYHDRIDGFLRTLAEQGKALEVDTSGLRRELGRVQPQFAYLRRFRELGGEIVTIGSDAHKVEHVGYGIEDGMELAREAGFTRFGFYKQRQARMIDIY